MRQFFLLANGVWTALYVLSRCVSAALLCHVLVSLALTVPGALLHLVPETAWCRLRQLLSDGRRSVVNSGADRYGRGTGGGDGGPSCSATDDAP